MGRHPCGQYPPVLTLGQRSQFSYEAYRVHYPRCTIALMTTIILAVEVNNLEASQTELFEELALLKQQVKSLLRDPEQNPEKGKELEEQEAALVKGHSYAIFEIRSRRIRA